MAAPIAVTAATFPAVSVEDVFGPVKGADGTLYSSEITRFRANWADQLDFRRTDPGC